MKKGKIFAAVTVIVVMAAMLAGCMAGISDVKINEDGSGSVTMKVGYTLEALKAMTGDDKTTPDLSGYKTFVYGDTTYYGDIVEKTFKNAEEFNTMTWYDDTMAEISTDEADSAQTQDSTNDRPLLKVNEDGSLELSITVSAEEPEEDGGTDDALADVDTSELEADAEAMMAQMAFVMTFEMPAPGHQTAGPDKGVTIDGNVLTIDLLAMSGGEEDVYYAFSTAETVEEPEPAPGPRVVLSSQSITVDGEAVELEVYNIDGYNYFKLRDMAMLLNGTDSQFEVAYNAQTGAIDVTSGSAYTPAGGELETGSDKSASCVKSSQSVAVNGEAAALEAYNLGGNNFFKLRDLGAAIGFGVDYNEETREVVITSAHE